LFGNIMSLTEARFKKRLGNRHRVIELDKNDQDNVRKIMKLLYEEGPKNLITLRKLLRGKRYHKGSENCPRSGMSPKRFHAYVNWLKSEDYVTKQSRKSPLCLSTKGEDYWGTRTISEMIADSENPEDIVLKLSNAILKEKLNARYEELVPIVKTFLNKQWKVFHNILDDALEKQRKSLLEQSNDIIKEIFPYIDQQYRIRVKGLGYEVVGDWTALKSFC
jgi:hypothetical protein